jgi:signal peptidase
VRGLFLYGIPKLGWVRQWVQQNPQGVLIGLGVVVAAYLIWTAVRPARTSVVTYPGSGAQPPAGGDPGVPPDDPELALRLREVAVREREVAMREAALREAAPRAAPEGPQ